MLCYTCGEFNSAGEKDSMICPACLTYYCGTCAGGSELCYICSSTLEQATRLQAGHYNPSDLIAETMKTSTRKHPRLNIELNCIFTVNAADNQGRIRAHKAMTKNISQSGLCIYSTTPLQVEQKITIEMSSDFSEGLEAVVKWAVQTKGYLYAAGLEFTNLK